MGFVIPLKMCMHQLCISPDKQAQIDGIERHALATPRTLPTLLETPAAPAGAMAFVMDNVARFETNGLGVPHQNPLRT